MLSFISGLTGSLFGASWTKIIAWGLLALTVALMLTMGALVAAHERGKRLEAERDIAITERDTARSQTKRLVVSIEEANRRLARQRAEKKIIQDTHQREIFAISEENRRLRQQELLERSNANKTIDTRFIH